MRVMGPLCGIDPKCTFSFSKGVSKPKVTLDKKEVTEGGVVTVNCSLQEEKPPIFFKIEKLEVGTKFVKRRIDKTSNENFVLMEFPIEAQDHVLVFRCQAGILSGFKLQESEPIRSEYVTVQGQNPALYTILCSDGLYVAKRSPELENLRLL
jgi:hypothetical protein